MNQVKILHCADLHLGSELYNIPERARERRMEILGTFRRITQLCEAEKVDLLLIAGDLFEGANHSRDLTRSVQESLSKISSRVFIAPGNHDYLALDSPYLETGWPDHVTIFKTAYEKVELADLKVTIHGGAFESTFVETSLLKQMQPLEKDKINIGVFHGDLVGANQGSSYHPIKEQEIADSGLDYLALGHIHKRSPLKQAANTAYAYPGSPDGRGFDETGLKGVYLGEIRKGKVDLVFRPTSSRLYEIVEIDGSTIQSQTEAEVTIKEFLNNKYGAGWRGNFYRVRMVGSVEANRSFLWSAVEATLSEELHYIRLLDETSIALNLEELAKESSLMGSFVRRMMERQGATDNPQEQAQIKKALEYGLEAFRGEVRQRDY